MSRRSRLIALLAPLALAPLGCDLFHREGVRRGDSPIRAEVGSDDPSFRKPEELKGFFKARSNGAWSSEAREIERSLGAY